MNSGSGGRLLQERPPQLLLLLRSPRMGCEGNVTFISFPCDTIESVFQMAGSRNQQENFSKGSAAEEEELPRKRRSC